MNTKESNFAYKVRLALDENLNRLPSPTTERLASARKLALSRKKQEAPLHTFVPQQVYVNQARGLFHEPLSWIGRMGVALPIIVLVLGLVGIYQTEKQQHISEIAEIDTLVLSDELPLSAYLDHGFNAYLAKQGE